jgi:transcriptional regulator with XRE-family HTH domain
VVPSSTASDPAGVREPDGAAAYLAALGRALRRRREGLGLSQEQLGFDAELDRTYVSGLERGVRNPTVKTLVRVCRVLGCQPSSLLRAAEKRAK